MRACVEDLARKGHLIRVKEEVDPNLEIAEIQRRLYEAQGPAILFERVKGSPFPAVCNLFGTFERCEYIFRDSLAGIKQVVQLKADPTQFLKSPFSFLRAPFTALRALPRRSWMKAPIEYGQTTIDQLPQIKSWPMDGGAFITLPQVYTEDLEHPGVMKSNVGMYRVQLGGNDYIQNKEIGLHYQIHRGIGVHHSKAVARGEKLRVSIFIGGPPAHTFGAVMPLPEGLSELMFAGMFANRRFRYRYVNGHCLSADADFCIVGTIDPTKTKLEGPFGDHLGYYSLQHQFPVMEVEAVYHRKDAIWPFTVVGRPPQEDTSFGHLIHEVTAPMVPATLPGLHAMHAVDAAGVHPLLLAIGSERYVPYGERIPQELLTIANSVLGFGQASLAKYLMIAAKEDKPDLHIEDIGSFFQHVLERIDLTRDLHFQTRTTMDTLDYSGTGLNSGSKVVIAAAGEPKRTLSSTLPEDFRLPEGFNNPRFALPGVLTINAPKFVEAKAARAAVEHFCEFMKSVRGLEGIPMIVLVDDSDFVGRKLKNFLWVTFTRSNPSHDIYGVDSFIAFKHWGCRGPMVIDARIKPHHAPPLVEDPKVTKRVDAMAAKGGILEGLF